MTSIIVGSTALAKFSLARGTPKDLDIWTDDESELIDKTDSHLIPREIIQLVPRLVERGGMKRWATPDAIYTIKMSHAEYQIKWQKTKLDILWLKAKGCKLIPELYEALKVHWVTVHGSKEFLSLNKTKDDFFNDNVTYVYPHDDLHELVAYPNRPIYERCLKDNQEVLIDKNKFFAMPFEDQVRMFREEISVIAAERWMINPTWKGKISWYRAYILSLEKTVTRLTKGWASEFILMNLEHFVKPKYEYFEHLIEELKL